MKALSSLEMQKLALELRDLLVGAQLQDCIMGENLLLLKFYLRGEISILFDFNPQCPLVLVPSSSAALHFKGEKKPLALFLKANIAGAKLQSVDAPPELGRVLQFSFGSRGQMEFRLFPRGQNCLAWANGKSIALKKPNPLKKSEPNQSRESPAEVGPVRAFATLESQWLAAREVRQGPQKVVRESVSLGSLLKRKAKIEVAIQKISEGMQKKKDTPWRELGDWLVANQNLNVPKALQHLVDSKLSFSENLNRAFENAKQSQAKMKGSQRRIEELHLMKTEMESSDAKGNEPVVSITNLKIDNLRGRSLHLPGGKVFFVGKSAADNLKLLRQAKPWCYWLHLRDSPSAHGIVHCAKNQAVTDSDWHAVAQFLIEKNFGEKVQRYRGQSFDLIIAECRHVRPIKGDKLGRVTYSKSRTLRHKFS